MSKIVIASVVVVVLCSLPGVAQAFTVAPGETWSGQGITITNDTDQVLEFYPVLDGPPNPPHSKWIMEIEVPLGANGHVEVCDENNTEGDGDTAIDFTDNRNPPDSNVCGEGLGHGNGKSCDRVNGVSVGSPY